MLGMRCLFGLLEATPIGEEKHQPKVVEHWFQEFIWPFGANLHECS